MLRSSSADDIRSLIMCPTIALASSSAVASRARSFLRRPLPASEAMNPSISFARWPSALPWSLTILRKKKSWPWIADVLLDRVLLQEAGATEGLERLGAQQHPRALGAVALHDREQQVVDRRGEARLVGVGGAGVLGDHDLVLPRRGVEHQRTHGLGERLLRHQRAAYVGVVGDRDAGGRLVVGLRQVGALDAVLG